MTITARAPRKISAQTTPSDSPRLSARNTAPEDAFTVEHFERWAFELELDNGEPWRVEDFFLEFVADVFSGVPECWLVVPEGNTKTTSVGGLVLYHAEFHPAAWAPWAASSRDQAEIGYRQMEGFVLRSSRLRQVFKCQEGYRRIKNLVTGGRIQIFAAADSTGDGVIPTLPVLDELHRQKDLRLYRTWRGKLSKRGGQLIACSTAGEPGGEFEDAREKIRQETPVVERRAGFVRCRSERIVLHEWAVDEGGDVEDMATVKAANPFTGITVQSLREKFESPTMTLPHWRRFVCNLPTRSTAAAIQEAEWDRALSSEVIPVGEPIDLGLDIGWKWDTTGIVPLWWRDDDFRLLGDAVELEPPRDGTSLDPAVVKRALSDFADRNPVGSVVMDMSRAEDIADWISSELGVVVVDRSQGNVAAAEDAERFLEALRGGKLFHTGSASLRRHVMNAIARMLPNGRSRFDRPARTRQGGRQDSRVIDLLVAASMVHSVAAERPAETVAWGAV